MAKVRLTIDQALGTPNDVERGLMSQPVTEEMAQRWKSGDDAASEAEAVLELRQKLKMTQKGIADLIGISVATWRNWEQGRRTPDQASKALLRVLWHEPEAALRALSHKPDLAA